MESLNAIEFPKQVGKAIFDAQVFPVIGRILADEQQFLHSLTGQPVNLVQNRSHWPAAELTPHLRDDAERTGMVTTFSDLNVGRIFWRGQNTRRPLVVQVKSAGRRST